MLLPGRLATRSPSAVVAVAGALLASLVSAGPAEAGSVHGDEGRPVVEPAPLPEWPPVPGVRFEEAAAVRDVGVDRVDSGGQEVWTTYPGWGYEVPAAAEVDAWPSTPTPALPPAPAPTPAPAPAPAPAPVTLRMAQANIKSSLSPTAFAADLAEVMASGPDFVTLNEAPRRSDDQITPAGYAAYRGMDSNWTRETPVLWRTDRWEQVAVGTRYLTRRPVRWGVRAVNWVTVRHRGTGAVVSVVSAHPAPTIAATRGLLPVFMTGLAGLVRELGAQGSVLVGGDLNMGYHGPLWTGEALTSARLAATYDVFGPPAGGTGDHGGATIDYVLFQRENGLTPTAQGTHELFSDHDAVWADFRLG